MAYLKQELSINIALGGKMWKNEYFTSTDIFILYNHDPLKFHVCLKVGQKNSLTSIFLRMCFGKYERNIEVKQNTKRIFR